MLEYEDGGNSYILYFNMKYMDSRDVVARPLLAEN